MPVEPLEAWHSEPFLPLFRRGRVEDGAAVVPDWRALSDDELLSCLVYARGSGDDKGPLYGNIMALRTMLAVAGKPPCRLKSLFDGEEEISSPNLPTFLRAHQDRFQGDVMVIADGPMHPSGRPTVSLGVRGVMTLEINLRTANQILHSGHYGNAAPNAAWDLVQLLATMGGSLPLHDLAQALHMPLISVPLANHDDNQHAPDENLRLRHFIQGIRTMLMVVHGLAQR